MVREATQGAQQMTMWRRVWTRSVIVLSLVLWISHLSGHASYARQVAAQAAASLESTSAAPPEQAPHSPSISSRRPKSSARLR